MTNPKSHPVVTIGMPVYNGEKYIREAIDSVLNQTFTNFELLISDNASIDNTAEICLEYANRDSRIRYMRQKDNIGTHPNFNFLFNCTKGRYFKWLACDDYLGTETFLENAVSKLDEGYDYVIPDVEVETWENGVCKTRVKNTMHWFDDCHSKFDFVFGTMNESSMLFYGLFNVSALKQSYQYLNECAHLTHCYTEGLFVHAIASNLKGCHVPSEYFVYRVHGGNVSYTQKPEELITDYIQYYSKTIKFFMFECEFSFFEKTKLLFRFIPKSSKYLIYLHLYSIKQKLKKLLTGQNKLLNN